MSDYVKASGKQYAIASGCLDATVTAAAILEAGGNIVDAAIAGSAVQCVTSPHLVSIGGDLFAMVKFANDPRTLALNATGAAPLHASIEGFRASGNSLIPIRGPLSVQSPGLVAGWQALLEKWATMPLRALLQPAIGLARNGSKVGRRLALLSAECANAFASEHGWSAAFLPNGAPLSRGQTLTQKRLADTLAQIGEEGTAAFYSGPIAMDIVETVRRAGGILDKSDLELVVADIAPALSIKIGAVSVATQPPVSQGVVLLRALGLLWEAVSGRMQADDAELSIAAARALGIAFDERLNLLGDSANSRTLAESMLQGCTPAGPARLFHAHPGPETTTLSIIDSEGNAISLINSVFADFGSGVVTDKTGILLNNRLCAFFLDPDHPNGLEPRKRTIQTLHSVIVSDEHGVLMAGGSPGGDQQVQVNLQVLARVLMRGQALEEAVSAPRWMLYPGTHPHHLAVQPTRIIKCEPGVAASERDAFAGAGFSVSEISDIGSAKWVTRSRITGALLAAADLRRDGWVAAR
jgi:gamma-glutamyltranspeptidase/glutathione hydrolase